MNSSNKNTNPNIVTVIVAIAILIPISPFWVKNFKTKKLFQVAAIIFGVGTILCAVSWNFYIILF